MSRPDDVSFFEQVHRLTALRALHHSPSTPLLHRHKLAQHFLRLRQVSRMLVSKSTREPALSQISQASPRPTPAHHASRSSRCSCVSGSFRVGNITLSTS